MTRLGKFPTFFILVALGAAAASVFGALHNQLSYSVGPSYFEALKFPQFAIPADMSPRIGAAWVGVQASWWMGAVVGIPAFLFGMATVPSARSYLAAGIGAVGLVLVLTTFAALAGLVGGIVAEATGVLDGFLSLPEGPVRADFLRAGFMHDASYIGGLLGALLAFWPMRRARVIDLARAAQAREPRDG